MNNDLISREALKRKFRNVNEGMFQLSRVYELIDNAPTVEPTFGLFKEMLCAECDKRPTGHWNYVRFGNQTLVKCSECEEEFLGNDVSDYRFCPICGCRMIEEANND